MATNGGGLSLPGLAFLGAGVVLIYTAIVDTPGGPVGALRSLLKGERPEVGEQIGTSAAAVAEAGAGASDSDSGSRKYTGLGGVKPHVRQAAENYGSRFGIKSIGGYRTRGSVPGSDHPRGLALDFMVDAKTEKARGDALAAALLNDSSVTYVIWNRRINSKNGKGWRTYVGPSAHTDHVHASFRP